MTVTEEVTTDSADVTVVIVMFRNLCSDVTLIIDGKMYSVVLVVYPLTVPATKLLDPQT